MHKSGRASHFFAACRDCLAALAREDRKDNMFVTLRCFPENEHSADRRRNHKDEGVGGGGGRSRRDEQERLLCRTNTSMVLVARRTCKSVSRKLDKFGVTRDVSSSDTAQTQVIRLLMFSSPTVRMLQAHQGEWNVMWLVTLRPVTIAKTQVFHHDVPIAVLSGDCLVRVVGSGLRRCVQ